ncbi:hypothetical protein NLX86_20395 [Streptomyces sp. A3M-1-3]|uniref:hypothetical protein n=1 Tax=Streptomyces sp. A3M-1-3 TaxID=2962044 RepID=UPI0020B76D9B|nr:hypothetical protein [Streptomyces sp. A3M-1-3]MCP3820369.1 hypothetical protein [Streptomyces sp. A3M-1-3]
MSRTTVMGLLVLLLLAAGLPTVAAYTSGSPLGGPNCQAVAFMSVVGIGPDCGDQEPGAAP